MVDRDVAMSYASSFACEDDMPSFGIATRSSAALVVGSDRTIGYFSQEPDGTFSSQRFEGFKFTRNSDDSVICVGAGGSFSMTIAREIALNAQPDPLEAKWQKNLQDIAMAVQRPRQPFPDEILVIRPDNISGVWIVTRTEDSASIVKAESHICIGDRSHARLLPAILWRPELPVDRLEVLARLTLSYANVLNPSNVGYGFDILTIKPGRVMSWKNFQVDGFEKSFTDELRKAFEAIPAI